VAGTNGRIFNLGTKTIEIEEHIYKYKQKEPEIVSLPGFLKNLAFLRQKSPGFCQLIQATRH
jgi:hypothetical protein